MRWRYATAAATEAAAKEAAAKKATAEQASAQKEARLLEAARGRSVCPGWRQELWRWDGANRQWLRVRILRRWDGEAWVPNGRSKLTPWPRVPPRTI